MLTKRDRSEIGKTVAAPRIENYLDSPHPIVEQWLRVEGHAVSGSSTDEIPMGTLSEFDDFRLRVTSSFLTSVEAGGAEITSANLNGRFELSVGGARLVAIIRQKMSEFRREGIDHNNWTCWPEHHGDWLFPTKNLKFSLRGDCIHPIEFSCSRRQVHEKGLKRFLVCIFAARRANQRKELKQSRKKEQQKRRLAEEAHRRSSKEMEEARWKRFQEAGVRWEQAQQLRSFIQSLRVNSSNISPLQIEGRSLDYWLDWAQSRVEEFDPGVRPEQLFLIEKQ